MSDSSRLLELVDILGAPAHVEWLSERHDLLRFADSRVTYQHSEDRVVVRARIIRDRRAAWGTTSTVSAPALHKLRGRLEAMVSTLPPGGDTHLAEPTDDHQNALTCFASTEAARAEDRAALLRKALAACPAGTALGGSIAHTVVEHSVANSRGLLRTERRTRSAAQFVGALNGQSSFGRTLHRDSTALSVDSALDDVRCGLSPLPKRHLQPGVYRAVLGPQATMTLLATYGQIAIGARQYRDGLSSVSGRIGERVVSPLVSLIDDGGDARGLPTSFDCQGVTKQRVPLITRGVLTGVVDEATGHSAPPGWRFGADPIPSHLLLEPGSATDDDLRQACGTGLSIQRVDYVRVVNARQTLVTGTTRDATLWIERGRIAATVPQFRFTLRLTDLLDSVEALGQRHERGDTVFMESVVAPAMVVSAVPVLEG